MRFEDLNWMDVEAYLEKDDRLMGACEQHAYLSLMTDVQIPLALADAAAKETGALVAPAINFGISPYFATYPGTFSIRITTLLALVDDIIGMAYEQGFRRFLVLNGHGGNTVLRTHLYELANRLPDMQAAWYAWWLEPNVAAVAQKHSLEQNHANWEEAFPFTRVCELPAEPKEKPQSPGITAAAEVRAAYGDGSLGGPYQAGDEIMEEMFAAALKDIVELLKFE